MTTAITERMSRPFCLQTPFTRTHTASNATAIVFHVHRLPATLAALHKSSGRNQSGERPGKRKKEINGKMMRAVSFRPCVQKSDSCPSPFVSVLCYAAMDYDGHHNVRASSVFPAHLDQIVSAHSPAQPMRRWCCVQRNPIKESTLCKWVCGLDYTQTGCVMGWRKHSWSENIVKHY